MGYVGMQLNHVSLLRIYTYLKPVLFKYKEYVTQNSGIDKQ
ncbi:hypothetical protein NIES4071_76920 [Calothrix sp. NIES-4071]|nr:hypothetical protein NIES4071_76920 [Calothrix sp. NIES-4071]BAZ61966.1 hypothetical protein NIES4105_76860 [Calothrix sp. NIES-4105]